MKKRWWHNSVAYQVYPKSFLDTNNDGIGDLRGITEKLDYLHELGIDVLWISPFFKSPMKDNGYDISDYKEIDPIFGTMRDFDEMLEKANQLGIRILVDLVVNHTSDEHDWFEESRQSKDNPKRDWYIWKDGKQPNNWRSCFGGSVWEYDEKTDSSYFHYFHKGQPCLNWENKEVRDTIFEMINWWLDKGIGGFRVDAIEVIKKTRLDENFEVDAADGLASAYPGCRLVKGIELFLSEMAEKTFNQYDIMTIAEADIRIEDQELWTGPNGFFDMAFQFKSSKLDTELGFWHRPRTFDLLEYKEAIASEQYPLNDQTWAAVWLENHDVPRSITKYLGNDSPLEAHKMLGASYFFLRGTPFIYQGQEIGMRNIRYSSIVQYDDIASIDQYDRAIEEGYTNEQALGFVYNRSRDNTRYPMQWDNSKNYGFSKTDPWLEINTEFPEITVENALKDQSSLLYFYKDMISLRKSEEFKELFSYGTFEMILDKDPSIFAYLRIYDDKKVLVINNFTDRLVLLNLDYKVNKVLLNNIENDDININEIRPYQSLVLDVE